MKFKEKELAIQLRQEKGLAINKIAKEVGVAKSSVSVWVRDIKLTEDQKIKLQKQNPIFNRQISGSIIRKNQAKEKRLLYQEHGKIDTLTSNTLHLKGCMLYWAEGAKCKNAVRFCNSDPDMMNLFIKFLRDCFYLSNEMFNIRIYCHTNNGLTLNEIEDYWISLLQLDRSNLRKGNTNMKSTSSKGLRKNKLRYGICYLIVNSTEIVQRIFGAIKQYSGIKDIYKWID